MLVPIKNNYESCMSLYMNYCMKLTVISLIDNDNNY